MTSKILDELEKEIQESNAREEESLRAKEEKRGKGRPAGSLNKRTLLEQENERIRAEVQDQIGVFSLEPKREKKGRKKDNESDTGGDYLDWMKSPLLKEKEEQILKEQKMMERVEKVKLIKSLWKYSNIFAKELNDAGLKPLLDYTVEDLYRMDLEQLSMLKLKLEIVLNTSSFTGSVEGGLLSVINVCEQLNQRGVGKQYGIDVQGITAYLGNSPNELRQLSKPLLQEAIDMDISIDPKLTFVSTFMMAVLQYSSKLANYRQQQLDEEKERIEKENMEESLKDEYAKMNKNEPETTAPETNDSGNVSTELNELLRNEAEPEAKQLESNKKKRKGKKENL